MDNTDTRPSAPAQRVAFVSISAAGHAPTRPILPVVSEPVGRGLDVTYFAPAERERPVDGAGAPFVALPRADTDPQHPDQMRGQLTASPAATAPDLVTTLLRLAPAAVVHDSPPLNGSLAARSPRLGIASATSTFALDPPNPPPLAGLLWPPALASKWTGRRHQRSLRTARGHHRENA